MEYFGEKKNRSMEIEKMEFPTFEFRQMEFHHVGFHEGETTKVRYFRLQRSSRVSFLETYSHFRAY